MKLSDMSIYFDALAFFWAFFVSVFAIPSIIKAAHTKMLLDEPNGRALHLNSTPRLGGLAIFAGFISSLTLFGQIDKGIRELMAGAIIIFFIGLKDDIVSVSAFKKVFVQILAAGIVIFSGDIYLSDFYGVLGIYEISAGWGYLFTFICIIGLTNAINLIDGLDGLAGSIVVIAGSFLGAGFLIWGVGGRTYSVVAFALVGAVLGFLKFNLRDATIFMGDTGSLVSGFIISVMAICFIEARPLPYAPVFVIAVLFVPIVDTSRVIVLRLLNGKSPFLADKNHLHHRLIGLGFSQPAVLMAMIGGNLGSVALVVRFSYLSNNELLSLLLGYALFIITIVEFFYKRRRARISELI